MADAGYSEIQLLGQNVNSYHDPLGKKTFAELLSAVGEVSGIKRVRFTTSHPRDFGSDIVAAIDSKATLCDHVHLPVQSGSTRVLQAMQRLYTRDQYLERIAWMKSARRDISVTTDVIVGFPGETEAAGDPAGSIPAPSWPAHGGDGGREEPGPRTVDRPHLPEQGAELYSAGWN